MHYILNVERGSLIATTFTHHYYMLDLIDIGTPMLIIS